MFIDTINRKDLLNMLRQNGFIYFHEYSSAVTIPSFLETMAMKNIIMNPHFYD